MHTSFNTNAMKSRILSLILQGIILLLCAAYLHYGYFVNINPDKQVKETFKMTECFLLSKKLVSRGHLFTQYRAEFRVSYNVNNVQYTKWVSGNGLNDSFTQNNAEQENILSQYDNGMNYPCWYNPDDHEQVVLVLRKNWTDTYALMVPAVIFILTAYYFGKNLLSLYRAWRAKRPRRRKPSTPAKRKK
jgi:hypothetical protein